MLVADLRRIVSERLGQIAAGGDEEATAIFSTYARAVLIALSGSPADTGVDLEGLTVRSRTASLIMGLHAEHVRHLIRQDRLQAAKENGEFLIKVSDVVDYMVSVRSTHPSRKLLKVMSESLITWQAAKGP